MADQPPFKFNREILQQKIDQVRAHLQSFVGRPGYNAFVWAAKHLTPLEERLNSNEQTLELHNAIASLAIEDPVAVPHNVINPPREAQAAGASHNAGQVTVQGVTGPVAIGTVLQSV